ncbi:ThiF family adenylyltransferase [Nonomuraea sp. FMUSA5-5]|uniref:ThiF family adenylyltransferase n=1 Tax=Nonomuraea composti TaxID=2720023 RepID=A0ABX1BH87_9ACTN|nr:ThiF family adenylyltransferase [Nonomuraea sp. FMUSA5-5]NJP97105.1 ThiF family adenylyltransferase [Nonomuraea sp. FMUSA5-5]
MIDTLFLLPRDGLRYLIATDAGTSGTIKFRRSDSDGLVLISYLRNSTAGFQLQLDPRSHPLNTGLPGGDGFWFRVPAELHGLWYEITRRGEHVGVSFDAFAARLPKQLMDPGALGYFALTYAPDADKPPYDEAPVPRLAAWRVTRKAVFGASVAVEPEPIGITQLEPYWPVTDLASVTVMVVGVGSIGGAAATALAGYGLGRLLLVDPDRLLWHNLIRHVLPRRYIGKFKVDALRDYLADRHGDTEIAAFRYDVVNDADLIRALLQETSIILCCTDGVAPRRASSHLARRAGKPAILACVLADGGIGEVIRLRPWPDHGCLLCRRQALTNEGTLDPEPALEAGYGTGTLHHPMTAVGSDLFLIGNLAAKITVSTALEAAGHFAHRLPSEHLTVGLQACRGWTGPFDLGYTGNVRWAPATPPRADCPTCGQP